MPIEMLRAGLDTGLSDGRQFVGYGADIGSDLMACQRVLPRRRNAKVVPVIEPRKQLSFPRIVDENRDSLYFRAQDKGEECEAEISMAQAEVMIRTLTDWYFRAARR